MEKRPWIKPKKKRGLVTLLLGGPWKKTKQMSSFSCKTGHFRETSKKRKKYKGPQN